MKEITDYGKVFETLIEKTAKYLVDNKYIIRIGADKNGKWTVAKGVEKWKK